MTSPSYSFTRDQLQRLFSTWNVTEPLPGPTKAVYVNFPHPAQLSLARVTRSPHKSTYGKLLYLVEFTARGVATA